MNQVKKQIVEKINEYDTIIIHRHKNPDPDALGSQNGLKQAILAKYPAKKVYAVGEEVEGLTFLAKMDEVSDETYKGALVIVCDTANLDRISDERYAFGDFFVKIDHHPDREPYGDLQWVETNYSSCSEMITELIIDESENLILNDKAARLLYAGIIGDTGRFLYDATTSNTLSIASELLKYTFKPKDIFDEFYKTSKQAARLQGEVLLHHEVTNKGVAYFRMTKEIMKKYEVDPISAANLVNTLSNIEGNEIWVFFVEYDEEIRVRIRSRETVINGVANEFNGGGHPLASGATVQTWKESKKLIEALNELL